MRNTLMAVAIGLLTAVVATAAVKIEVAKPQGVDYSTYASFAFQAKEGIPDEHPLGEKGELFKEVSEAAAKTLLARGLTYVRGDTPDLWVTFFGLTEEEYSSEGTTKKVGAVTWVGDPGAHSTRTVLHATLIVELFDAATGERVWSGWASDTGSNPEKMRARAAKATRMILEEFQPE